MAKDKLDEIGAITGDEILRGEDQWKRDEGDDEEKYKRTLLFATIFPNERAYWNKLAQFFKDRIAERILLGVHNENVERHVPDPESEKRRRAFQEGQDDLSAIDKDYKRYGRRV